MQHGLCSSDTSPGSVFHRLSHSTRSHRHYLLCAVSWSPNIQNGLGRSRELHPAAPVVAAPALLEACGFSVCSEQTWRVCSCWIGNPAWPVGQCVFAVGGLPNVPGLASSARHIRQTARRAPIRTLVRLLPTKSVCPCFGISPDGEFRDGKIRNITRCGSNTPNHTATKRVSARPANLLMLCQASSIRDIPTTEYPHDTSQPICHPHLHLEDSRTLPSA